MITIDITQDQIDRAKNLYGFVELKDSITHGEGNLVGAIGEIICMDYFKLTGNKVEYKGNYDYDIVVGNIKIDVKTTKCTSKPLVTYSCNVNSHNTRQKTDLYLFVRITTDFKTGYLLGYIKKEEFYKKAVLKKEGEREGDFILKSDCYSLQINKLKNFK